VSIWTGAFWLATAERAVKTFAQTAASLLLLDEVPGLLNVDWAGVGSVAGLAALMSVLLSVGGNAATGDGPSAVGAEVVSPPAVVPPDAEARRANGAPIS
jgi:hypothetical protein